jgi:hypothetical protein
LQLIIFPPKENVEEAAASGPRITEKELKRLAD